MPNQKKKSEAKSTEVVAPKSAETETSATPQLTVLQLRPKNNYAEWVENNENYFSHTYGSYGEFFETLERYRPKEAVRPTVVPPGGRRDAAPPARSQAAAPIRARGRGTAAPTAAAPAPRRDTDESSDNESPNDSDSSDEEESVYSDENDELDQVATEEAADYIYNKRLESKVKDEQHYERVKPQMYADLLRSLGSEAKATVRTSSRFMDAQKNKDEVLLRKICHKKLRQYSTARGVTKEIKSAKNLYQIHQFNTEHTSDYYERFKREVDAYETYMEETLPERRKAAIFTEGLNNARYGAMKIEIENGITKRKDTLTKAYRQAMRRVVTKGGDGGHTTGILASNYTGPKNEAKSGGSTKNSSSSDKKQTKREAKPKDSDRKSEGGGKKGNKYPCTTCKLLGIESFDHRAYECPNENKALEIVKEASMFAEDQVDLNPPVRKREQAHHVYDDVESAYVSMRKLLDADEIIFDPGSTLNLFHNRELLEGEVIKDDTTGISTWGGKASAHMTGTYKGMTTYLNPDGPVNLLSQAKLKEVGARIHYDDSGEGEYTVTLQDGEIMQFPARPELGGLYVFTPERYFVNVTVKEKLKIYTKREQRKAIEARANLPNLGFPSDKDYAAMLKGNNVQNASVTAADVYRATRIFGKDIPSYMGKQTRKTPPKIDLEKVEVMINKKIWLGMDVFVVNSGAYMLSVSTFRYKMVTYMGILNKNMHNDADTFWFHIRYHVNSYRARGFQIAVIETDNENAFVANKSNIEGLGIRYEVCYGSKVEEVERAIRPIKERHRAYGFYLPFPITHLMEKYLVLNCARLLNTFPTQGNGYEGIPPTEIYRGTKLNWKIDFPLAYGDVCLVPSDIGDNQSKTAKARGEIAIAMLPHGNQSGDITFLNTRTMCKLVRNQFTIIPTPEFVISYLKRHVGNRFAESRRNPIYRSLRGEIIGDAPQQIELPATEQAAELEEPVVPVNRDTSDRVDEEIRENDLPNQEPIGQAAEPESREEEAAPDAPEEVPPRDEELPEDAVPDAPTVDIEDVRRRYPLRSTRSTWKERSYFAATAAFNANKQLNLEPRHRLKAMAKEIYGIAVLKQGFEPVNTNKLTYKQLKGVISSKLFTKAKYSPDGEFEKWKARLVAGGHLQKREDYTYAETSSPTVGVTSVLAVSAIAAKEKRKTATADFTAVSNKLKYVGMILDFSYNGECRISMPNFVDSIVDEAGATTIAPTPAGNELFTTAASDELLDQDKSEIFHSLVMKLQYLAKRVRPDILLPVVYLSSRVTKSTIRDWTKLMRIIRYLKGTRDLYLRLKPGDGILSIFAFVDASFAVHHDFKSHTGAVITFGTGCIFFKSTKQKLNTKSSTEAELVAISDALSTIIWLRDFLIEQGYNVGPAVLYQDNMSTIALVNNGKGTNERSRHINIKFFFVSDRVGKGEIEIKYMPTNDMLADMLTKPIQGDKFRAMRDHVLGINDGSDSN